MLTRRELLQLPGGAGECGLMDAHAYAGDGSAAAADDAQNPS